MAQLDERDDHFLIVYDIPYGVEKILKKKGIKGIMAERASKNQPIEDVYLLYLYIYTDIYIYISVGVEISPVLHISLDDFLSRFPCG